MKKWLNIEVTKRDESEQSLIAQVWSEDKPNKAKPVTPAKVLFQKYNNFCDYSSW